MKSWAQYNEDVARAKEARNQDRANRHANNIQGAPLGDVDGCVACPVREPSLMRFATLRDTVEGVLESIVQKVAMELADEIERAEAAVIAHHMARDASVLVDSACVGRLNCKTTKFVMPLLTSC